MLRLGKNTYWRFLFFGAAIFCFCQVTAAQSGRRVNKNPAPVEQKPAVVEAKPVKTEDDSQKNETGIRISSMMVVGEIQHNFTYYNSNQINIALKECVGILKSSSKSLSEVTRGSGKTSYTQAKELAEKETETYVLWLGFTAKDNGYGEVYIDSVQYALLMPKTARVVTRGTIEPGQTGVVGSGGVLNIPNVSGNASELLQMKDASRRIAGILLRGGWLD